MSASLKEILKRKHLSQRKLAELLDLSQRSLSLKISNQRPFTLEEIRFICRILDMDQVDAMKVFFHDFYDPICRQWKEEKHE